MFQVRTKLAGDIYLGPWDTTRDRIFKVVHNPTTFIYKRTNKGKTPVIGAFSWNTPSEEKDPDLSYALRPKRCPFIFPEADVKANFSAAPLDNVILAKVFHPPGKSYCRGLLFVYRNGAQRSLGDCRVGVDPFTTYEEPGVMRASIMSEAELDTPVTLWRTNIWFLDSSAGAHAPIGSPGVYGMTGTLHFWFDDGENEIDVFPTTFM